MCYKSRILVEQIAAGLGRSMADVWESLESLRLAWNSIGHLPCAEIDDLCDELDPHVIVGIVDLLAEPQVLERYVA